VLTSQKYSGHAAAKWLTDRILAAQTTTTLPLTITLRTMVPDLEEVDDERVQRMVARMDDDGDDDCDDDSDPDSALNSVVADD